MLPLVAQCVLLRPRFRENLSETGDFFGSFTVIIFLISTILVRNQFYNIRLKLYYAYEMLREPSAPGQLKNL